MQWIRTPIIHSRDGEIQKKNPQLITWRKANQKNIEANFKKYNVEYKLPQISANNFDSVERMEKQINNKWSNAETKYLFDLVEMFHGNFILVNDRFDASNFGVKRSIEDLKERVYNFLKVTHGDSLNTQEIYYDKESEQVRKLRTERYMSRNSMINKKEEEILSNMKNISIKISKKEKEENGIRNMLNLTCGSFKNDIWKEDIPNEETKETQITEKKKLKTVEIILSELLKEKKKTPEEETEEYCAFNRGNLMTLTVPNVAASLNEKLVGCLKSMGLDNLEMANEENHDYLDKLKKSFIKMFVLKSYLERKTEELSKLELIKDNSVNLLKKRQGV